MHYRREIVLRKLLSFCVNVFIAVVALAPIVWGLSTSLKPTQKILSLPPEIIPSEITFVHYRTLIAQNMLTYVGNSMIVSLVTVMLCLTIGTVAAYSLSRFEFKGRSLVLLIIIAVMSIPIASLIVPSYTLMASIGLTDKLVGLIVLYTAYQLPIVIWIMYAYIGTIPREIDNAAMIDGYSRLASLRKVVLPLCGPGLIASGLFVLTFAWNDFVVAAVMITSDSVKTLPVAIYSFLGYFGREWGPLLASSMVSIIPVIAIFILFQRYFLSGMTGGSVKG
ncbi:carbohydrate ABC transporter permease [Microvirga antarctica]|uniref:carbohydrate ABC transporter permease n=1 Tax=Microvirga antarctica TaxID=2819233 RepID=UPI001B3025A1|nr:carbohydrate ABC transporter permease [Microvirga antarctica]